MVSGPAMTVRGRALVWDVPAGWVALSSAAVGGGLVTPRWVVNVDVGGDFLRTDLAAYVAELADDLGLAGPGCALLTAADVTQVEHATDGEAGRPVQAWATVGVTKPTWPVPPAPGARGVVGPCRPGDTTSPQPQPGTINIVVALPVPLSASALVQAVGTITEAKAQVLVQAGVPGTGTASDAVVVLCPEVSPDEHEADEHEAGDPVAFAGVRSAWGQRVARAVHAAVAAGLAAHPWPAPDVDPAVVW